MRLTRVLTQTPAMSFTNLQRSGSSLFTTPGWRGGLVVGRRTCDLVVAGSRPGRDAATYNLRQVVHTLLPLSPSSIIGYQRKLGNKQAYRVVHQPVSRGFAVFADAWLSDWLAEISADLREDGSALEVVLHDYALYKSTFTLLYFTYLTLTPWWSEIFIENTR